MLYFVKTPGWLMKLFPNRIWKINTLQKEVYFSFDDGPHPAISSFVLGQLAKYNAKASFFCIGKNVVAFPDIYQSIIEAGHTVGNHTHHHLNGFKVKDKDYLQDILIASEYIDSNLFRPPYGRMTGFQYRLIKNKLKVIMWSVLSGDFDKEITKERCLENVLLNIQPGAIVVFHDSEKAFPHLQYVLPAALKYLSENGYSFKSLEDEIKVP